MHVTERRWSMRAIFDRTSTLSNGLMKHDEPSQSAEFFNAVKTADIIQPHKGSDLPADWKHSKPLSEAVAPQELGHAANFEKSAQKPRTGRPDRAPKPSIAASVPSSADRRP